MFEDDGYFEFFRCFVLVLMIDYDFSFSQIYSLLSNAIILKDSSLFDYLNKYKESL